MARRRTQPDTREPPLRRGGKRRRRPDAQALDVETLMSGIPALLFLLDAEDRFVDYRAGEDLYVPPESFLGRRVDEVLPPPAGTRLAETIAQARRDGRPVRMDYALPFPEGERHFEARVRALPGGGVAALCTDVTAQRVAEERLRESEERFRRAFADAPVGMALVGLDERFLQVNDALCSILGYPAERLLQLTVPQVTHPDDVAREKAQKVRLLGGDGSAFQMEKRYLHADGHVVWGALSVSAVNDREGNPRYYIGQLEDVTERRRAEEALRQSEERFRALIENATDLLVVFDEQGTITLVSPAVSEALGWAPPEMLGRPGGDFIHPEDLPEAARVLDEVIRSPPRVVRATIRLRHKDGSWRVVEASLRSLLHVPAVRGVVANGRDVTEQRRLEERFLQAQNLESVGRLAGGVAHDFNNLLVAILGYAAFLEEGIRAGKPSLEDLAEIRGAGERARDLTRQLLAVARRQVLDPRVMDLNEVLRDAEKLLRRVLGEDVDLALVPAADLWRVKADPSQVQQVVLNLAVNARDAMPQGGKLTLETANVVLDERYAAEHPGVAPGAYALLAVSDSGVGMSPEAQAHLFEPFFTTKPAGEGTGLGLATVYGIVRQAGGHVWVTSEPGQGTSFQIYLPRTEEAEERPEPRPERRDHRGSETVLVVEDEPAVRELAARALAAAGYRVLQAPSGRQALEEAERVDGPVHLLVTDVVMPDMSGQRLAESLKTARPGTRVLYMSGYTENTIVHHGVLDAGVHFLAKPFTPAAIQEKVREVLDAGRAGLPGEGTS